jgi:hypothetical protein
MPNMLGLCQIATMVAIISDRAHVPEFQIAQLVLAPSDR